jgi:flagellar biosynthesis chaperone FliJ
MSLMMSWLGEFLELSRVGDRGERLQEVCRVLRGLGFSNSELSSFSSGVYPTSSINRWTSGVKVTSSAEKDELMSELRGFVEGGHKVSDIEACKKADSLLRGKGLDFERSIKLAADLESVESTPTDLQCLAVQLRDNDMTVADVKRGVDTQRALGDAGLSADVQQLLLRTANKYKTSERILGVIDAAISVDEVSLRRIQEEEKVKELLEIQMKFEAEIKSLEADTVHLKADIAFAKTLREKHHFDQSSMNELQKLAEKHGTVTGVIGALNAYTDLQRINGEVAEAEARKKTLDSEISHLRGEREEIQSTINAVHQSLGATEQLTKSSRQIMILAELIVRPREARADDYEIANLCRSLLSGVQERAAFLTMDPKLKRIIQRDMNIAVLALDVYLRGVA